MANKFTHNAYWISPDYELIPVPVHHANVVIENPDKFGLTREYIEKLYEKHSEGLGSEGYAREELTVEVIKKGWARLRYYPRQDNWILNIYQMDSKTKKQISEFLFGTLRNQNAMVNKYSTFAIMDLNNEVVARLENYSKAMEYIDKLMAEKKETKPLTFGELLKE